MTLRALALSLVSGLAITAGLGLAQPTYGDDAPPPRILLDATVVDQIPTLAAAPVDQSGAQAPIPAADVQPFGWRSTDQLHLALTIDGPGQVTVHDESEDAGGDVLLLDTGDGVADELTLAPGEAWPTWEFAEPGDYLIQALPSASTAEAGTVAGEPVTYWIRVADGGGTLTPPAEPEPTVGPDPAADPDPTDQSAVEPEQEPSVELPPAAEPRPRGPAADPRPRRATAAPACDLPGLASDAVAVDDGHFDFGVQVAGGDLLARIKDDRSSPAVWRKPDSVLFSLGTPARAGVPEGSSYSFLGEPGDPVWTIGQAQESGIPWLGWNTQHESAVGQIEGPTTWRIDEVDGPGALFIYQSGSFGSVSKVMSTESGWPGSVTIRPNTHVHASWSFTEPGGYRVTTTHRATLKSGRQVSTQSTLYFEVANCAGTDPGGPDDADDTDDADESADDSGTDDSGATDTEDTDDTLPNTGAPESAMVLVPLGAGLVVAGGGALAAARRGSLRRG